MTMSSMRYLLFLTFPRFLRLGDYPEVKGKGVNLPECGMRYKPAVYRLKFNDQCFKNALPFKSRTVYDVGIGIRLEDEPLQPTDESLEDDFPEEVVPKNRVFKGAEAEYGEAPWTVLIKVNRIDVVDIKGKKFAKKIDIGVCTGVLVAYEWIVTAATCLMEGTFTFEVHFGFASKGLSGQRTRLVFPREFWIHPNFEADPLSNNIAVAQLDRGFRKMMVDSVGNYLINTVCLPTDEDRNQRPEIAVAFGFGLINETTYAPSLRKGFFALEKQIRSGPVLSSRFEGSEQTRLCAGDTGSGLVQYTDQSSTSRAILGGIMVNFTSIGGEMKCDPTIRRVLWAPIPKHVEWIVELIDRFSEFDDTEEEEANSTQTTEKLPWFIPTKITFKPHRSQKPNATITTTTSKTKDSPKTRATESTEEYPDVITEDDIEEEETKLTTSRQTTTEEPDPELPKWIRTRITFGTKQTKDFTHETSESTTAMVSNKVTTEEFPDVITDIDSEDETTKRTTRQTTTEEPDAELPSWIPKQITIATKSPTTKRLSADDMID